MGLCFCNLILNYSYSNDQCFTSLLILNIRIFVILYAEISLQSNYQTSLYLKVLEVAYKNKVLSLKSYTWDQLKKYLLSL